jgi:hypothetical protein
MYGCTEIDILADHLELKQEWVMFKHMMSRNFKYSSIQGIQEDFDLG